MYRFLEDTGGWVGKYIITTQILIIFYNNWFLNLLCNSMTNSSSIAKISILK